MYVRPPACAACGGHACAHDARRAARDGGRLDPRRRYMPDEYIVREGIVGTSMYFIQRGTVRIVKGMGTAAPQEIGMLTEGNFFGEVALTAVGTMRRNASVISHTVLWVQRLNKADVYEIGRVEPLLLYTLRRVAIARRRELGEDVRSAAQVTIVTVVRVVTVVTVVIVELGEDVRSAAQVMSQQITRASSATAQAVVVARLTADVGAWAQLAAQAHVERLQRKLSATVLPGVSAGMRMRVKKAGRRAGRLRPEGVGDGRRGGRGPRAAVRPAKGVGQWATRRWRRASR